MADNDWSEVIVASVALAVSLIALLATSMQVMQQYYASARGYSQCNEKVMGKWASTKKRRFSWEELRFEVEFDSPVIFLCPPKNDKGPIPGESIHYLDGSPESLQTTWTVDTLDYRKDYEGMSAKERVHTADNERASWFILLYAVQRMESTSASWQKEQYAALGPPSQGSEGLPRQPPSLRDHHTLSVAVQRKRKSWDTMPSTITRPYATTTMCHLIELMAVLGVYWKEFDRKYDRYRAEGNGFMVLGERISDLGLMFSFQIYGQCHFERNRVIPVDEIKELCFGFVPTIYRKSTDKRRLESPVDETRSLSYLQMATRNEVAETLVSIGCNNNAVQHYRRDGSRTSHLFPLSFEIVGMLAKNLHIPDSCFTYIPNPTSDRWDKRAVSLIDLMRSYGDQFDVDVLGVRRNTFIKNRFREHIDKILGTRYPWGDASSSATDRIFIIGVLHEAINDADEVLTAKRKADNVKEEQDTSKLEKRPQLPHNSKSGKSEDLLPKDQPDTVRQLQRRSMVQDVLRSHFQEVLRQLNERDDRASDNQSLHVPDPHRGTSPTRTTRPASRVVSPRFDDINEASPDERQRMLMELYFEVIRPKVVKSAESSAIRRASIASAPPGTPFIVPSAPAGYGLNKSGTSRTHVSEPIPEERWRRDNGQFRDHADTYDSDNNNAIDDDEMSTIEERPSLADEDNVMQDDIWLVLVFRMICWLMLHDFNKADIQVSKSELLGSRMPVYVN